MAKEIVINVSLEAQGVVENIQKIETELDKLRQQRQAVLESGLSVDGLTSALGSIDSEIQKLEGTYNKLIQSTESYSQVQQKSAQEAEKAAQSQAKLEKTIKVSEGITKTLAGSVNLATSAFAAFGVENEDVQQSLLKVQAAASFATGIKDLTEGFKALNVSGIALNKTLLANPFVLIATLVVSLIGAFGGFEVILKVVTDVVSAAFAPFTALFEAIGLGGSKVDDATTALEKYQGTLDAINNTSKVTNALLESEIALLEAQGATIEDISKKRTQLLKDQLDQTTATQQVTADYIDQLKFLQEQESKGSKEYVRLQGEINKAVSEVQGLKAKGIQLDTQIQIEAIKLQKEIEKREKDKKDKQKADNEKFASENKARQDKEKADTLKAIQDRIKSEGDLAREANAQEIDALKQRLLDRKITEETFNAERRLLEIKGNEELAKVREKFAITEKEQKIIGAEETKKINAQINKEIIDAERKNIDIRLAINKQNDADQVKADEQAAKDRLDVIERDFLRKKQQLLDLAATDETFTQQELNKELQKLEIEKNETLLKELEKGSKEYLALENVIKEARLKLEDETNKEIIAKREKLQAQLLDTTKVLVEGIGTIVQEVSPLFESVGQTALQTLEKISTEVPDLLAKFQDETLSNNEKLAAGLSFVGSAIGEINTIVQDASERRIAEIDAEEEARIASLERQKEAGLITEEQLAAGVASINKEAAKKRREEQKKAFNVEKGIRIVQAVAQTAAGVLNAFTAGAAVPVIGPTILAPLFAGIAGAFGAAQIALIASQKFPESEGGASATAPSVPSVPSAAAQGNITPTQFAPDTFGTGAQQEQTFGQSTNANVGGNVLRAYVVESDISSTSERLNTIRQTSEL